MLKVLNYEIYGLYNSIIASNYPKNIEELKYEGYTDNDFKRAKNLGTVKSGSGHDCFLKGITVQLDVKFPLYWLKQFQRYHFADIISSQSTMHCITKFNLKEQCNKYVDKRIINIVNTYIEYYNNFDDEIEKLKKLAKNSGGTFLEDAFGLKMVEKININDKYYDKQELFMLIISNLPSGFEMIMRITTNYLQLKTIYFQRKNHKIEDWHIFCDWIKELPKFKELILGEKNA